MIPSINNPIRYSAIASLSVHAIVVVFAGNYILFQDRLLPPPKKTYKLEVIEKSKPPLAKKKPIKKVVRKKVDQAIPLKPKATPQAHTPAQVLTVAQVARDVPAKPIKRTPLHNSPTVSRQTFIQKSTASASFRSASVSPRSAQPVIVSNHSKSGRSVVVSSNSVARAQSEPARKMTQTRVMASPSSGKSMVVSSNSVARAPSGPARKMTQTRVTPAFASKGGSLIQSDIQRISAPSHTSSPRTFQALEGKQSRAIMKTALGSPGVTRVSSAFEPRAIPNIIDQGVLQGYSRGIQRKIAARKKYPKKARRRGEEGLIIVQFTVLKSGKIRDLLLVSATPYAELNEAALNAVRRAVPFPSFPDEIGEDFLVLELPFRFEIK